MVIPAPHELGFPEKFDRWRANQAEAIRLLVLSAKRVKALSAPTGFGKTAVYMAAALLKGKPTCFVTDSRGLQDQLMEDYGAIGLVDIRGKRNYACSMRADYTCEEGAATRCTYRGSVMCPASAAEMRAARSSLVVTNYSKWTTSRRYGQGMDHFQSVVFDEGHNAPDALASAMQVVLNAKEINEGLGLDFPSHRDAEDFVHWKPWAGEARAYAEDAMLAAKERLRNAHNPKQAWVQHFLHMRNLTRRLALLANADQKNWIVDEVERGYQFDPIRPGRYGESALLCRMEDITVVSATLRPKTLYMIGIPKLAFDFKEFDSDFDPTRCPIYYTPTQFVDVKHPDQSLLWAKLDTIAARRTDRKGIVQTVSFARRDAVVGSSRFSAAMLVNPRGEAPAATIEEFRAAGPGTILVSPSFGAGYDFPGDQCEWQFVCKIPFPDGRNRIVQARQEDDKEYGPYQAINKLVQIFGRGMRSKDDRCENFIGDKHVEWFIPKFKHLAPKWFHAFLKRVETLPQPPPRL